MCASICEDQCFHLSCTMTGLYSRCIFKILSNHQTVFQSFCSVLHFTTTWWEVQLLYSLINTLYGQFWNFCYSDGHVLGFPGGSAGEESTCNVGDLGLIPGLGRSPWRRERLPTPVYWPGEFHGLYSPWGLKESGTTEQLSLH